MLLKKYLTWSRKGCLSQLFLGVSCYKIIECYNGMCNKARVNMETLFVVKIFYIFPINTAKIRSISKPFVPTLLLWLQLVKSLIVIFCMHLVKVYNSYASTIIIYKVNRIYSFLPIIYCLWKSMASNQTNLFVLIENFKSIHYD